MQAGSPEIGSEQPSRQAPANHEAIGAPIAARFTSNADAIRLKWFSSVKGI